MSYDIGNQVKVINFKSKITYAQKEAVCAFHFFMPFTDRFPEANWNDLNEFFWTDSFGQILSKEIRSFGRRLQIRCNVVTGWVHSVGSSNF